MAKTNRKRQFKPSFLDNLIGVFSPRAKAKRLKFKAYSDHVVQVKRKYEGADTGRRTGGWCAFSSSGNAETQGALIKLRNRSRDLIRNNPYAKRGMRVISNNTVGGRGILTQIKTDDDRSTNSRERQLNGLWNAWAKSTACDFHGHMTLAMMQRQAMNAIGESGEVLVRFRREEEREIEWEGQRWRVPAFSLQVLESDFLVSDITPTRLEDGRTLKQGIILDDRGRTEAYRLYQDHPGDIGLISGSRLSQIEVAKEELLHIFDRSGCRPNQLRGVPWLAPVILRLRDFDLFEDATLKRQQCAAMFTAFVHDIEAMDEGDESDSADELGEKMEPGIIELLPPGKDVKLSDPPGAENYGEYTSVVLHSIATGLDITYAALTGNLQEVNFSSGRMGWIEMHKAIEAWRNDLMIDQFLRPVWHKFKMEAELVGAPVGGARAVFTPPRREMIDPTKEVKAAQTAVRSGFQTLSGVIRELGHDPDTHLQEIAADNETLDNLGLTLDSDARTGQNEDTDTTGPSEPQQ